MTNWQVGAAILVLSVTGQAAAGTLDDVKARGELRVGTPGDYRPFAVRIGDGYYRGADIDTARSFAADLHVGIVFVPTSWKTLLADFSAHRFDMAVGGISVRPDRAEIAAFSVPLQEDGKRPVARCADAAGFGSVAVINRQGVRVAVNSGGSNEVFARSNFSAATIVLQQDNTAVPRTLVDHEADVFVTDGIEADLIAGQFPGVLCAVSVPAPFTHEIKAWMLPKDAAFDAAVDRWLAGAIKSGKWKRALAQASVPGSPH